MSDTYFQNLLKEDKSQTYSNKHMDRQMDKTTQKASRNPLQQVLYGSYHSINACPPETIIHKSVGYIETDSIGTKQGCDQLNYLKMVAACLTFVPVVSFFSPSWKN